MQKVHYSSAAWGFAQLVGYSPSMSEPWLHSLAPYKLGVEGHGCKPSTRRWRQNAKVYGNSQPYSEFKVSPGYLRPCLRLVSGPSYVLVSAILQLESRKSRNDNSFLVPPEDPGNSTIRGQEDIRIKKDLTPAPHHAAP